MSAAQHPIAARASIPKHGPGGPSHGPAGRMMPGEKPRDFKGTMGKLLRFMGRFKGRIALVVLFAVGSTVFNIVGPKVLSEATTALFDGVTAKVAGVGGIDLDLIFRILAATLALYLFSAACSWVQGWVMSYVSQATCYRLRQAIVAKIDRTPLSKAPKGEVGGRRSVAA